MTIDVRVVLTEFGDTYFSCSFNDISTARLGKYILELHRVIDNSSYHIEVHSYV